MGTAELAGQYVLMGHASWVEGVAQKEPAWQATCTVDPSKHKFPAEHAIDDDVLTQNLPAGH